MLVLAGCGGGSRHAAAPHVVAVDAPAPGWVGRMFHPPPPSRSHTVTVCLDTVGNGKPATSTCTPTAAQKAQLAAQEKRYLASIMPVAGSTPRTVARLALRGGGRASFVAWRTAGGPCWVVSIALGGGGPSGSCLHTFANAGAAQGRCDALCLSSSGGGTTLASFEYVLAGTVPARGERIRIAFADGSRAAYPLDGPLLRGAPDRRVFMLDLGPSDSWRRVEVVRGGTVVARLAMPRELAAFDDCTARLGPPPPFHGPAAMRPYERKLNACVRQRAPSSQARPTTTP